MNPTEALLLREVQQQFRRQRELAERAFTQVPSERWSERFGGEEGNSLSVQLRHVGGNLRSRWLDALTSDGEKSDRNRDGEFEDAAMSAEQVRAVWDEGWRVALASIDAFTPADLARPVSIRGKELPLAEALIRSLDHTGHHVGQIVMLSKHLCGDRWQTLSMPRAPSLRR